MNKIAEAQRVFDTEIKALKKTRDAIDDTFVQIVELITTCQGKVIVTGMGKPGHVAGKIAATLASLGTPSFYLHPAEAMHGDLGMVSEKDVVIAISFSGESDEILRILPNIKFIGAILVGITGNPSSTLARESDLVQVLPKFSEACNLGLAPTSSTTVVLCYGDALAVAASAVYGFKDTDYARFHPAGSLGKRLILRVEDLMVTGDGVPKVTENSTLIEAIGEMTKKGLGLVSVVDAKNRVIGIITDGDLRRVIERRVDIYGSPVEIAMTRNPKTMTERRLAIDALKYIKQVSINNLPIVDENNILVGTITWQMIVKSGIIL